MNRNLRFFVISENTTKTKKARSLRQGIFLKFWVYRLSREFALSTFLTSEPKANDIIGTTLTFFKNVTAIGLLPYLSLLATSALLLALQLQLTRVVVRRLRLLLLNVLFRSPDCCFFTFKLGTLRGRVSLIFASF